MAASPFPTCRRYVSDVRAGSGERVPGSLPVVHAADHGHAGRRPEPHRPEHPGSRRRLRAGALAGCAETPESQPRFRQIRAHADRHLDAGRDLPAVDHDGRGRGRAELPGAGSLGQQPAPGRQRRGAATGGRKARAGTQCGRGAGGPAQRAGRASKDFGFSRQVGGNDDFIEGDLNMKRAITAGIAWIGFIHMALPLSSQTGWQVSGSNVYLPSGRVGIGTSNPQQPLDVSGQIRSGGSQLLGSGQLQVQWWNTGDPANQKFTELIQQNGSFTGRFVNDAYTLSDNWLYVSRNPGTYTTKSVTFPSGSVGIGATNPNTKLEVWDRVT